MSARSPPVASLVLAGLPMTAPSNNTTSESRQTCAFLKLAGAQQRKSCVVQVL
ncbi:hypothetical protein DUNSADRAFT_9651 [Dunaliella salina]|uniref:Encoded protein n=1 Tax=Dunaliella salina TaxID=3046 RepID=A0ABQ7GH26_DUNSA|nr:hypothetical protein DUNSADRAFT_9651 [Dunaliella salina]|eukprot:KAF5833903.1 hypothetical protein DUNSADRAFT_9651 [Dunaliella salina]